MPDDLPGPDPRYYPKAKYCVDGSNRVVADPRAEASLDPSQWFDNPSQAKEARERPVVDSDESWVASDAVLQAVSGQFDQSLREPKRRGRPPKVTAE